MDLNLTGRSAVITGAVWELAKRSALKFDLDMPPPPEIDAAL